MSNMLSGMAGLAAWAVVLTIILVLVGIISFRRWRSGTRHAESTASTAGPEPRWWWPFLSAPAIYNGSASSYAESSADSELPDSVLDDMEENPPQQSP